ncbi:MAG: acetylglutamate kinase [Gemmatimonadetes bacterium]|nr:acetylglutamate kinase [Gemmatimonadota bacterium]
MHLPPSSEEIEKLAHRALGHLPRELSRHLSELVFQVVEFPDDETMDALDLETPFDILGLYQGVAIGEKGHGPVRHGNDMVFLYRRPILDYWCESGQDLDRLVGLILLHEIGHHFGFSDAEMARFEESF